MERSYSPILMEHLEEYRQMIFVVGPRQVGKTTLCRGLRPKHDYFNWDNQDHRALIIDGPGRIGEEIGINQLQQERCTIIFDEIHMYNARQIAIIKEWLKIVSPQYIIFLSATIGNPAELAEWLDAELIEDDWRPVKLDKGIYMAGQIEFS